MEKGRVMPNSYTDTITELNVAATALHKAADILADTIFDKRLNESIKCTRCALKNTFFSVIAAQSKTVLCTIEKD